MAKEDLINKLTKIKGIGKTKAESLYKNGYNSIEKLKKANIKDLTKIEGITQPLAKSIKNQFMEQISEKIESKKIKEKTYEQKIKPKKEIKTKSDKEKVVEETLEEKKVQLKEIKEIEEISKEKKKDYIVKKKPKLKKEIIKKLYLRKKIKKRTPDFLREEWFRYKKIPKTWRKPEGISSKMRRHFKYRPNVVRVGYRGPKITRGLHSSGFKEILIFNVNDLDKIEPDIHAARIGCSVGTKKRIDIEKRAKELDIRILNSRG